MARVQGNELLLNPDGHLLVKVDGATVTITLEDGVTPATVYAGPTTGATVTQPLTSENGLVVAPGGGSWWLEPGVYWRLATHPDGRVFDPIRIEAYSGVDAGRLTAVETRLGNVPINAMDSLPPWAAVTRDNSTDTSAALQTRLDECEATGRPLYLPGHKTNAYIAGNLQVGSNTFVFGDPWITKIKAPANLALAASLPGGALAAFHRFIFVNKHGGSTGNSGIAFAGLVLDGNVANGNATTENYFGIALWSVQDVRIDCVKVQNMRGDGIYVNWNATVESSNVRITGITLDNVGVDAGAGNPRQGISIVQCRRGSIRDVVANRVSGPSGTFGYIVDLEPNVAADVLVDFTIEGIHGYDCVGGVQVVAKAGGNTSGIHIDDVTMRDGPNNAVACIVAVSLTDNVSIGSRLYTDVANASLANGAKRIWLDASNPPTNLTVVNTKTETQTRAATTAVQQDTKVCFITGSGAVSAMGKSWAGHEVTFRPANGVTFTDGVGTLRLNGNFAPADANSTITLVCDDGTNWVEKSRSVNG